MVTPTDLIALPDAVEIVWPDGRTDRIPAQLLRRAARDATSLRERYDTGKIRVAKGIEVVGCDPVGAYGVNIKFSDGHERAIYPFTYLREIADAALATN